MKRILLTGAGAPGGPGIIKALLKQGFTLFTGDCNLLASGRFLHKQFVQLPKAEDEAFTSFVLRHCLDNRIDVVFPLVTKELFPLSLAKKAFAQHGIRVIVSDDESLRIANDKDLLYQHLQLHKVPVPAFAIVKTIEELITAAKDLGYPSKAVVIKPTISNGSRGVRILQENMDRFDLLFHTKPNHLYSNLEEICSILSNREFPPLLVAEYLPGEEYTVDTLVQNGEPKLILPRRRIKMNGGISVQGTFVQHTEIIVYCDSILRSLSLEGPIGIQVKEDVNGQFRILEINPRIQGTSVAALGMGINLPALAVQQLFQPIEIDSASLPWGVSFVRYYEEVFYKELNADL